MAELGTGSYTIRNLASGKCIGFPIINNITRPQPIVNLPERIPAQSTFRFEGLGGRDYTISLGEGGVVGINGNLFAISDLFPIPGPAWRVVHDERRGGNHFIILDADEGSGRGWFIVDPEDFTQVAVGVVIVGPSEPPFYPPNNVWVLEKA